MSERSYADGYVSVNMCGGTAYRGILEDFTDIKTTMMRGEKYVEFEAVDGSTIICRCEYIENIVCLTGETLAEFRRLCREEQEDVNKEGMF